MNEYKNKKCLVTGGTGLIGRQVVDLLVNEGADVYVIALDNLQLNPKVHYWQFDLRDRIYSELATKNKEYVFHLAGIKASPDITLKRPATMSIIPLMINTNVLEACRINGIKNVLFTSSIGAYAEAEILTEENAYIGNPMDFLPGQVKRMAEYQIQGYKQEFGLDYKVVRCANTYGIGDNFNPDNAMFIPSLMAKVLRGDNPVKIWGDGSQIRDFVYSKDIAKGILQMMLYAEGVVNLGSGYGYSIREVTETLNQIAEVNTLDGIRSFNYEFDTTKPSGVKKRVMDISKAKSYGYNPTYLLKEGLKETWEWFKSNKKEYEKRLNYFDR